MTQSPLCRCGHQDFRHFAGAIEEHCKEIGCKCERFDPSPAQSETPDSPKLEPTKRVDELCTCGHHYDLHDFNNPVLCLMHKGLGCECEKFARPTPVAPNEPAKCSECGGTKWVLQTPRNWDSPNPYKISCPKCQSPTSDAQRVQQLEAEVESAKARWEALKQWINQYETGEDMNADWVKEKMAALASPAKTEGAKDA